MQVLPANQTLGASKVAAKALPPNPVGAALSGKAVVAARPALPVHHLAPGAMEQFQQEAAQAAAPAVARYNHESGGTQGIVPGIRADDLHDIRTQAAKSHGAAAAVGSLVDPVSLVTGAVHGAEHLGHGVGKIVHGNLGGGAVEAGLGALGVAGVLPFGRAGKLVADGVNGIRTAEEASQHLAEVAAAARAEGHAFVPNVVPKGVVTPETGGELGGKIRESLVHAPAIRAVQKAGYSEARGEITKAAAEARLKAGGGTAGQIAAKAQMAGPLSKGFFGHLKDLTPEQVDEAHRIIEKAPLREFEITHANDAITNAVVHGVAPTESEHALLERVFGKVAGTADAEKPLSSFWDKFVSYTNITRAVRSALDVSAGFRQGLVVLVTHPKVWGRAFGKSIKSFGSENFYQAQQAAIQSDPLFPLMVKWKVPFTDIGEKTVANTEEAFIGGQAAEHLHELPGVNKIPGATTLLKPASNVIRRSDRAFTGFQNGARFELAKMLAEKAALLGHDLHDEHLGQSIAKVVGTFTGRGVTPKILEGHLTTLNLAMFSPRLMAARLNLISPVYYKKLDPFARAEAMNGARNLVASIGTVMFVAKALGADVNFDPRSSNFAKIKIGNTRIDIAGGFSQYVRFIAQEMTREAISSAGTKSHIGWGQNDISDLGNLTKLGRSKSAPIPGTLWDELSGKDFIGQPVKQGHELFANAPFIVQDTRDAQRLSGTKSAVVAGFLSAIGLGVQSYKDKPPKNSGSGSGGGAWGDQSNSGWGSSNSGWVGP